MKPATGSDHHTYQLKQNHYLIWGNSDEFLGSLATTPLGRTFS
jgi:hypothetical protein